MTFYDALMTLFKWAYSLIENIGVLWYALMEPRPILSSLLGFDVSLFALVGVGALILGIIHAIVGFIVD